MIKSLGKPHLLRIISSRIYISIISPTARPSSPRNCTAKRVQKSLEPHLSVKCMAGYDGGLTQHFTLDVLGENSRVLANVTASYIGEFLFKKNLTFT